MEDLIIRPARKTDIPGILALYKGLEDGQGWNTELSTAEDKFERMGSYPHFSVYIAEWAGEMVGSFELLIMDNLAHQGASSAIVEDVVVKAGCQGKGIGKAMMEFAMQVSREQRCYKMVLSSSLKRIDAHCFYEQMGFRQHGISFMVDL